MSTEIRFAFICAFVLMSFSSIGQIPIRSIKTLQDSSFPTKYDSTENYLGKSSEKYIGQAFMLLPNSGKKPYKGFITQISGWENKYSNIYKPYEELIPDNLGFVEAALSSYDQLAGKEFYVADVIKNNDEKDGLFHRRNHYIRLVDTQTKETFFFKYDAIENSYFPFVVKGYYEKIKNAENPKAFLIKGKNWYSKADMMRDINTGLPVSSFRPGEFWKIDDVAIDDKYYRLSYIISNKAGEQITLPVSMSNNNWVFDAVDGIGYMQEFGGEFWKSILEEKIQIGMTKKMCELSWGKPIEINKSTSRHGSDEQWVYGSGNYLYFNGDKLVFIQN